MRHAWANGRSFGVIRAAAVLGDHVGRQVDVRHLSLAVEMNVWPLQRSESVRSAVIKLHRVVVGFNIGLQHVPVYTVGAEGVR